MFFFAGISIEDAPGVEAIRVEPERTEVRSAEGLAPVGAYALPEAGLLLRDEERLY